MEAPLGKFRVEYQMAISSILGRKLHFVTEMHARCTAASLVDGPVKETVEQGGLVVVAHREPEPPDRVALRVDAARVVKSDGLLFVQLPS